MKIDHIVTESLNNVLPKIIQAKRKELAIWDVDDTLFSTDSKYLKIRVMDRLNPKKSVVRNGKAVTVTTHEFADMEKLNKLLDDVKGCLAEPDSFKAFRSAKIFRKHAKAIDENIKHARRDYNDAKAGRKFFLALTARANMTDDVEPFLQHFEDHGLNIRKEITFAHLIRARSVTSTPGPEGKKEVMVAILRKTPFIKKVDFWDDSSGNIAAFKTLASEFPNVQLIPHHIKK